MLYIYPSKLNTNQPGLRNMTFDLKRTKDRNHRIEAARIVKYKERELWILAK